RRGDPGRGACGRGGQCRVVRRDLWLRPSACARGPAGRDDPDRRGGATRMSGKLYPYVGPEAIRSRSAAQPCGRIIESPDDLRAWLAGHRSPGAGGWIAATFVIDPEGVLRLADRRSERVAC